MAGVYGGPMIAQRERDLQDALDALLKHFKRHTQHRCEIVTEAESVLSGHQLPRFEVPDDLVPDDPVSYEGRTVILDTRRMEVNRAYWLIYRNVQTAAILGKDGSVTFYRIPSWLLWLHDRWQAFMAGR